jgi:putative aldouronate transport system substrate-binding protein
MSHYEQEANVSASERQGMTRRRFLAGSGKAVAASTFVGGGALGTLLAACGGGASNSNGQVTVTYTFDAFTQLPDASLVAQAMSNTPQFKKLNIQVALNPIDQASYDQKLQLGYAAGQEYDVVFTAPWVNVYTTNAQKGNFQALDDLLPRYAPDLYKSLPTAFWDAVRVNGKIYGVPNQNYFAYVNGIFINQKFAQKYAAYLPSADTLGNYTDIEPFLDQIKAHEPGVTPVFMSNNGVAGGFIWSGLDWGFDVFAGSGNVAGIRYADKNLQIVNPYATPEFQQAVELRWAWGQKGYFKKDPVPPDQGAVAVQNGQYAVLIGQQAKPNDIPGIEQHFGVKLTVKKVGPTFISTQGILQNMNAIPRSCPNPQQALQFLNLVNSDPTIFNLLCHGVEGKHYVFVDKSKELIGYPTGVTATSDKYNPGSDWMFGNEQNGYYTDPSSVGIYASIQQANSTATRSAAFGFSFDPTNVTTQIAQLTPMTGGTGSLTEALGFGQLNPQDLPKYLTQLKQAGADDIIAEAQKQLNAWKQKHS